MVAALPSENDGEDLAEQYSVVADKLTTRTRVCCLNGTPATHILVWTRLNGTRTKTR